MDLNLKVGDKVKIWITNIVGEFLAEVIDFDDRGKPRLRVLGDQAWQHFILKDGDYVVTQKMPSKGS